MHVSSGSNSPVDATVRWALATQAVRTADQGASLLIQIGGGPAHRDVQGGQSRDQASTARVRC
jgi:hypothetical protein